MNMMLIVHMAVGLHVMPRRMHQRDLNVHGRAWRHHLGARAKSSNVIYVLLLFEQKKVKADVHHMQGKCKMRCTCASSSRLTLVLLSLQECLIYLHSPVLERAIDFEGVGYVH